MPARTPAWQAESPLHERAPSRETPAKPTWSGPLPCHAGFRAGIFYFSRKLLVTTVTLESAMAADASTGESRPSAATGIPTVL